MSSDPTTAEESLPRIEDVGIESATHDGRPIPADFTGCEHRAKNKDELANLMTLDCVEKLHQASIRLHIAVSNVIALAENDDAHAVMFPHRKEKVNPVMWLHIFIIPHLLAKGTMTIFHEPTRPKEGSSEAVMLKYEQEKAFYTRLMTSFESPSEEDARTFLEDYVSFRPLTKLDYADDAEKEGKEDDEGKGAVEKLKNVLTASLVCGMKLCCPNVTLSDKPSKDCAAIFYLDKRKSESLKAFMRKAADGKITKEDTLNVYSPLAISRRFAQCFEYAQGAREDRSIRPEISVTFFIRALDKKFKEPGSKEGPPKGTSAVKSSKVTPQSKLPVGPDNRDKKHMAARSRTKRKAQASGGQKKKKKARTTKPKDFSSSNEQDEYELGNAFMEDQLSEGTSDLAYYERGVNICDERYAHQDERKLVTQEAQRQQQQQPSRKSSSSSSSSSSEEEEEVEEVGGKEEEEEVGGKEEEAEAEAAAAGGNEKDKENEAAAAAAAAAARKPSAPDDANDTDAQEAMKGFFMGLGNGEFHRVSVESDDGFCKSLTVELSTNDGRMELQIAAKTKESESALFRLLQNAKTHR